MLIEFAVRVGSGLVLSAVLPLSPSLTCHGRMWGVLSITVTAGCSLINKLTAYRLYPKPQYKLPLNAGGCVVQVGMPADQAQYIHRVGRTARAGKQGQALLLLHDFERFFLRNIAELPVEQMQPTPLQVTVTCWHAVNNIMLCSTLQRCKAALSESKSKLVASHPSAACLGETSQHQVALMHLLCC